MKLLIVIIALIASVAGGEYAQAVTPTIAAQGEMGTLELEQAADHTAGAESHGADASTGETGESHSEDPGVIGMFGLNWKLFLAQLINFGIILLVLWKWVFGPVTAGLSKRTATIEASLADAKKITEDRQTFDTWKKGEIMQVRNEAAVILTQAKGDAETLRQATLAQTKSEQDKIMEQARQKMVQEKNQMLADAQSELAEIVVAATEKIMRSKLDQKKDAQIISEALKSAGANV